MTIATAPARRPATSGLASRAPGIELLGPLQGSGYRQAPYLVRRADGQMLQLTRLCYLVAAAADGARGFDEVAAVVSADTDRPIDADGVRYLVETKLAPLGVVSCGDAPTPAPRANPMLALRGRVVLLRPGATNVAGRVLAPFFHPGVVVCVLAGCGALDYWLFFQHGLGGTFRQVLRDPAVLLAVLGLTLLSAVFHELGHATGCRRGGARPGAVGFGMYLIWPSFFTDVTDAYRLGRTGRLRTDLGGIYFNAVFILGVAGAYALSGQEALLLVILLGHWEVAEQLLPFIRFDGYFILSDLVGIPDLFARIGPVIAHTTRRGRYADPRVTQLRPSARVLVTVWVLCVVPFLGLNAGYLALHLPRLERALTASTYDAGARAVTAVASGRYPQAALDIVGGLLVALSAAGVAYVVVLMARQAVGLYRRSPTKRRSDHVLAAVIAAVGTAGLAASWVLQGFR